MENKKTDNYISIFFGIVLILGGVGFLLDQLNVFNFGWWFGKLWPLLIIIPSLISLITNWKQQWLTSSFMLIAGVFFLAWNFGYLPGDAFSWFWRLFWPVVLIVAGVNFLLGHKKAGFEVSGTPEDSVNLVAIFGGNSHVSNSQNFIGGEAVAIFGGIEIDLRDAKLSDKTHLNVMAIFGGVDIKVPKNVKVVMSGVPVFGGYSDSTKLDGEDVKVLNIYCTAIFGGVDVKN